MNLPHNDEKGMALVVCLLIMVIAAMIGIGVATDSTTSGRIARNQRDITRDFFIADGTNQIEVPKIATDQDMAVKNIAASKILRDDEDDDYDRSVTDITDNPPKYRSRIRYHFYQPTIKAGYSLNTFNSYLFSTQTQTRRKQHGRIKVNTVQSKIGPKI